MSATTATRSKRKIEEGWVVSDKMDKTRVVVLRGLKPHSQYGKIMHTATKIFAHDEQNKSHTGDKVRLMETRKLSKKKTWRVTEILK